MIDVIFELILYYLPLDYITIIDLYKLNNQAKKVKQKIKTDYILMRLYDQVKSDVDIISTITSSQIRVDNTFIKAIQESYSNPSPHLNELYKMVSKYKTVTDIKNVPYNIIFKLFGKRHTFIESLHTIYLYVSLLNMSLEELCSCTFLQTLAPSLLNEFIRSDYFSKEELYQLICLSIQNSCKKQYILRLDDVDLINKYDPNWKTTIDEYEDDDIGDLTISTILNHNLNKIAKEYFTVKTMEFIYKDFMILRDRNDSLKLITPMISHIVYNFPTYVRKNVKILVEFVLYTGILDLYMKIKEIAGNEQDFTTNYVNLNEVEDYSVILHVEDKKDINLKYQYCPYGNYHMTRIPTSIIDRYIAQTEYEFLPTLYTPPSQSHITKFISRRPRTIVNKLSELISISKSVQDVDGLEYIYSKMDEKMKKNCETYIRDFMWY